MNRALAAHFVGLLVVMGTAFALVARANAAYLTCPASIILCAEGCQPNFDWVNLYPCCDQVSGGCCVRNCVSYQCDGIPCQWITQGHFAQEGDVAPGNCGFNPACSGNGP